ncbi:hypothetical protein [Streptomyces sp. SA15]|uniref:hypothetical protein n=1 Tax=Streptomyces sp. SA15 TaxID=934019 RepID=UPI0011801B34|nr:hypothetical protein [Streptomyces sp. SA15]
MPFNTQVWVVDEPDCFTIYIDKKLITKPGAVALQQILRTTATGWRRIDNDTVYRTLRAVTG